MVNDPTYTTEVTRAFTRAVNAYSVSQIDSYQETQAAGRVLTYLRRYPELCRGGLLYVSQRVIVTIARYALTARAIDGVDFDFITANPDRVLEVKEFNEYVAATFGEDI